MYNEKSFSTWRCAVCFVWGIISVVVTLGVVLDAFGELLRNGSGSVLVSGMVWMVFGCVLLLCGLINVILRVTIFRLGRGFVIRDDLKWLKSGQVMLISPWIGILILTILAVFM